MGTIPILVHTELYNNRSFLYVMKFVFLSLFAVDDHDTHKLNRSRKIQRVLIKCRLHSFMNHTSASIQKKTLKTGELL